MKTTKYILTLALTVCYALGNLYAINSSYYSAIDGKKDSGLREALTTLVYSKHTKSLSYDWDFDGIDWDSDGNVYDIYSDCGHTKNSATTDYKCCCDAINREHIVPQSIFASSQPQKADRHHLYVVDGRVNNHRSDYAFGECSIGAKGTCNNESKVIPTEGTATCSNHELGKLGKSTFTEVKISDNVYEPADEYKGDIARAIMYMVIRYATTNECRVGSGSTNAYPVTAWSASSNCGLMFSSTLDTNYGLSNYGKALLLKWHRNDPVSAKEIARNEGVAAKQGNRNPFIDYPCLAEYLWGNKVGETVNLDDLTGSFSNSWTTGDGCPCGDAPAITLPIGDIDCGATEANTSVTKTITVKGVNLESNLSLAISGTNSSFFSTATQLLKESAISGTTVTITYTPTAAGEHSAVLTISGGGLSNSRTFNLSGTCCNPYVVTLSRNGITETVGACGTFTLPTADDEDEPCDGWEFKGWVTSGTPFEEGQKSAPTFVAEVSSATTLYAVYGKTETGGGSSTPAKLEASYSSHDGWTISGTGGSSYWVLKQGASITSPVIADLSTVTSITFNARTYGGGDYNTVNVTTSSSDNVGSATASSNSMVSKTISVSGLTGSGSLVFSSSTTSSANGPGINDIVINYSTGGTSTTTYKKSPCATYTISYADADGVATGGNYWADMTTALAGATITLDYDLATNYEFTSWTVTNTSTSAPITVTNNRFTMPDANVTVQANFTALCTGTLATPTITATPSNGTITLTWQDVTGATSYDVTIGKGEGYTTECSNPKVGNITHAGTTNTCEITGLVNGLSYTATVMAHSTTVCDGIAGTATATPTAEQVNSHNVTFTPSMTGATVTVNGKNTSPQSVNYNALITVAVTPAAHYTLTGITLSTGGTVTIDGNSGTFIMPDEDVTVTVTMTEETKYTVMWYVSGNPTTETKYAGEALEGISNPTIDCNGKTFQGWTANEDYSHDTDAPSDLFTDLTNMTMPVNGANYYAVFATETTTDGGSGEIAKTTSISVGDVVYLVYESGSYELSGISTTSTKYGIGASYSTTPTGLYPLEVIAGNTEGSVAFKNGSAYLNLGGNSNSLNTASSVSDNSSWTVTFSDGNAVITNVAFDSRTIRWNNTSGQQRFACYTSGQEPVQLYKAGSGSTTTYTGYTTSCAAPTEVTVTFNANGGEGTMATQTVDYNATATLTANAFTRTGYTFQGWATSANGEKVYNDKASVTLTSNLNLYAVWRKNSHNVSYTVTPAGSATVEVNNSSVTPQSVQYGEQVTVTITADDAYRISSVIATGVTLESEGNTRTFAMPDADVAITVTMALIPTHTVTWSVLGEESNPETYKEGAPITFPATDPSGCNDKVFVGWTTDPILLTDDAPSLITSATMGDGDITYYAVFAAASSGSGFSSVVDELTRETTGVTGTSYTEWSGISGASGAVYAGQSAGGNSSIQLRSTTPSSIITTTSGGKATKVAVSWNSNTANGRTLNVYGKNSAYTAASDLYSTSTQGTLIGTIVYGTSTELTIEDDYEYIGLCSASGAMYLSSISITWSTTGTTTYSGYTTLCYEAYTRDFNNEGDYATFCFPYTIRHLDGATAYNVEGRYLNGTTLTGIQLVEETKALTAGQSYVIQSSAITMYAWYSPREDAVADTIHTQGLVGNLGEKVMSVPAGCYGLSSNQLRRVAEGANAKVGQYKAYFRLNGDVPKADASVTLPGSKTMHVIVDTPTDLDDADALQSINWNEPVYNILGIRVGKDATGVLIQNGRKFLR